MKAANNTFEYMEGTPSLPRGEYPHLIGFGEGGTEKFAPAPTVSERAVDTVLVPDNVVPIKAAAITESKRNHPSTLRTVPESGTNTGAHAQGSGERTLYGLPPSKDRIIRRRIEIAKDPDRIQEV